MFRIPRLIVPAATVALIAATGCGGGDEEPTPVPDTPVPTATDVVESVAPTAVPTTTPEPTELPAPTALPTASPTATATPDPAVTSANPTATAVPPTAAPTATPTAIPTPTPLPPTATPLPPTPTPPPPDPSQAEAIALTLTAQSLGVSASSLSIQSTEAVTWSNKALGCDVPGRIYKQTEIDGWRIIVTDGTNTYEFHSDGLGEDVNDCAERDQVLSLPSINLVEEAGLANTTAIVVFAVPASGQPIEVVSVEDPQRIEVAINALDGPTYLTGRVDCTTLYLLEFDTPTSNLLLSYGCTGRGELMRGGQAFWSGNDGIVDAQFQLIINQALAAREFPAFPPTP